MTATPAGPTKAIVPAPSVWKDAVRFVTPYLEAFIISLVAKLGFHVTLVMAAGILTLGGTALGLIFRALEHWFPWVGALLGYIGAPAYRPTAKNSLKAQLADLASQYIALQAQVNEGAHPSLGTAQPAAPSVTVTATPSAPVTNPPPAA